MQFTKNGKACADSGVSGSNLKDDCYGKFADFLTTTASHFIDESYSDYTSVSDNYGDISKGGAVSDNANLWALGNYSRFVRPGAQRFDISAISAEGKTLDEGYNDPTGVMCSAYRNADGKWVVVAINYAEALKSVAFRLDNGEKMQWQMYRTSDVSSESLAPVGTCSGETILMPRSITTFVQM